MMLISEFARRACISSDTVRFYIRKGLLAPQTGAKGGSNPYQMFSEVDLEAVRMIRMGQSLGFSLREITALAAEHNAGGMTSERSLELMRMQLARTLEKAEQVNALVAYLRAKVAWLESGGIGPEPRFEERDGCMDVAA